MKSRLHIIGLGPAGVDKLTLGSYKKLKKAEKVFVRTLRHPCVEELIEEGVQFISFDGAYGESTFEEVYERIVLRLEEELSCTPEVIYAVPGHPNVAEKTVSLLQRRLSAEVEVVVHPALSFLDEVYAAMSFDPVEGMLVKDQGSLKDAGLTGKEWLVVPQVYSSLIASDLKLDLMETYPDETLVYIVGSLGSGDSRVLSVPLYELDHQAFDHLTSVVLPPQEKAVSLTRLMEIMNRLRAPDGCPWDREQTHDSLKPYLIEESYEVLDAIEAQDVNNLCEELGDLLLQVVFHAQVATESQEFNLNDVLRMIIEKLIRRHPHVFGNELAETAGEVVRVWDKIKEAEKAAEGLKPEYFKVGKGLPALMQAAEVQRQAAKVGFDWPDWEGPWSKVQEELTELRSAVAQGEGIREELGDLIFATVNLARFFKLDAEDVLRSTVLKFKNRFLLMVELAEMDGLNWADLSLTEMDVFWEKAKNQEKSGKVAVV